MELQRNMKFYGLLDLLPGPVTYYDVQKLYSISYDDGTHRCALEHAIDELKIEKSRISPGACRCLVYSESPGENK